MLIKPHFGGAFCCLRFSLPLPLGVGMVIYTQALIYAKAPSFCRTNLSTSNSPLLGPNSQMSSQLAF
ncbi:hypothetical protein VCHA53P481_150026 [Vibrio chagasii]|nr:hypothetical protein VCHA32O87_160026 [Vibrio chagasii]CAH6981750.1 hypothetical protein VCHA36P164_40134 [Vibrio chagasii]CAH6983982.1 hypothetical protein VCHA43P284_140026 [Vibrio chagasii]CAH7016716.1 hypothetical protein VCHA53P481_150026 [Vibrio chagasii]CAH7383003.1 hypothetical protein VCHA40P242_90035 [Vibrio chagasii]